MKRPRREEERLLRRLALTPGRTSTRRRPPLGLLYVGLAVATLVVLVVMLAVQDSERIWPLVVLIVLAVLWAIAAFAWVMPLAFGAPALVLEPLGLALVAKPGDEHTPASDGGHLPGAVVYAGVRHGHRVEISHKPAEALTVVSGIPATPGVSLRAPTTVAEMAALTGEREAAWWHVTVDVGPEYVAVHRQRNGAAGWMLHDLLLAETLAARR